MTENKGGTEDKGVKEVRKEVLTIHTAETKDKQETEKYIEK